MAALAPLSNISTKDAELSIDFSTQEIFGFPVVLVGPKRRKLAQSTRRQSAVCDALALGLSNKSIARQLGISPATVKDNVHAILQCWELARRVEIIAHMLGTYSYYESSR